MGRLPISRYSYHQGGCMDNLEWGLPLRIPKAGESVPHLSTTEEAPSSIRGSSWYLSVSVHSKGRPLPHSIPFSIPPRMLIRLSGLWTNIHGELPTHWLRKGWGGLAKEGAYTTCLQEQLVACIQHTCCGTLAWTTYTAFWNWWRRTGTGEREMKWTV